MSEHTPGPWHWFVHESGDTQTNVVMTIICKKPYDTICEVWADGEIGKADSRLIAAAPNLLEACESTLTLLDLHAEIHSPTAVASCGCAMCGQRKILRAAIAKARGITPPDPPTREQPC